MDFSSGSELQRVAQYEDYVHIVAPAFSHDGSKLTASGPNRTAQIWDVASGKEMQTLHLGGWMKSAAFSPDGSKLATDSDSNTNGIVLIWDVSGV